MRTALTGAHKLDVVTEETRKPVGRRVPPGMIAAAPLLQGGWQKLLDADPIGVTELLPNGGDPVHLF